MNRQKSTFNELLRRYHKYLRKRRNLILSNRNHRRQAILTKHIERLYKKLCSLKLSIEKGIAVAGVMSAILVAPNSVEAQTFGSPQTNPFNLTAVSGSYAAPAIADLDNDGDLDVIVGRSDGAFEYFENIGSPTAPNFATAQVNPFNLANTHSISAPYFVDIDNDGDFDLFAGDHAAGSFRYYPNNGTAMVPSFGPNQYQPFGLGTFAAWPSPCFVDLDNDGDFDLMAGRGYDVVPNGVGPLTYFENTGTALAPNFVAGLENPFGLTSTDRYSAPAAVDFDNDGDFDLLVGDRTGGFNYFENIGTDTIPNYDAVQINPFSLVGIGFFSSKPAVADFDNDGDLDLLVGRNNGNLYYFEHIIPEILVKGNEVEIINGDTSATASDSTYFGSMCMGNSISVTYKLFNTGVDPLTISTPVTITGTNASDFLITSQPNALLNAGDSTALTVQFTPSASGARTADVNISNNDGNEGEYTFRIEGVGLSLSNSTDTYVLCDSLVWIDGNTYTSSNNTATFNIVGGAVNGCDSLVALDLTIPSIDTSITNTSPTLTANQSGATYQWVDCDNGNSPIASETSQSFTATANGNYAVEITVGSCTETSACENVTGVGIKENIQNHVPIYPNPTTGIFTINLGKNANTINYSISSIEGRIIEQGKTSQNIITIDLNDQSKGIYFLKLNDGIDSQVFKIMKQ